MASDTYGSVPRFKKPNAPMLRLKGINKLNVMVGSLAFIDNEKISCSRNDIDLEQAVV